MWDQHEINLLDLVEGSNLLQRTADTADRDALMAAHLLSIPLPEAAWPTTRHECFSTFVALVDRMLEPAGGAGDAAAATDADQVWRDNAVNVASADWWMNRFLSSFQAAEMHPVRYFIARYRWSTCWPQDAHVTVGAACAGSVSCHGWCSVCGVRQRLLQRTIGCREQWFSEVVVRQFKARLELLWALHIVPSGLEASKSAMRFQNFVEASTTFWSVQ